MQNLEELGNNLLRSPQGDTIRALAESPDGRALGTMVESEELSRAITTGDSEALRKILKTVLASGEGKRILGKLEKK